MTARKTVSGEPAVGSRVGRTAANRPTADLAIADCRRRFATGDVVRVADRSALGHCRTPFYLRGKPGVVAAIQGTFRNPEMLAYHKPGLPALTLYKVRFRQSDLWVRYAGPAADELEVDIYEHWLEPMKGRRPMANSE